MSGLDLSEGALESVLGELQLRELSVGLGGLTPDEQLLFRVHRAWSLVQNGGFRYFYEICDDAREIASAFDQLEMPDVAEAWRRSISVFPNGVQPVGDDLYDVLAATDFSPVRQAQDLVLGKSLGELNARSFDFIRRRPGGFRIPSASRIILSKW